MTRRTFLILIATIAVLATAVGALMFADRRDTPTPTSTAKPSSTPYDPKVNDRYNVEVKVGGDAGPLMGQQGKPLMNVAVTEVKLDFACPADSAVAPKNGHYVAVHVTFKPTDLFGDEFAIFPLTKKDFHVYANDKEVADPWGNADSCLTPAEALPGVITPDKPVDAWVVFDLATTSGSVAYAPASLEWTF